MRPLVTIGADGGAITAGRGTNDKEIIEYNDKNSPTYLYTRIISYTAHIYIHTHIYMDSI